jgi:hypothetical protein
MEWFKKHGDTLAILGMFAACFWNMNEKFNDRFNQIDKELAIIKTVLVMKGIMPIELAHHEAEDHKNQ